MENQQLTSSLTDILSYNFKGKDVRTLVSGQDGSPWLILKDTLDAMHTGTTVTQAVESIRKGLGDGYVTSIPIPDSMNRLQDTYIVNEPAVTFLVSRSNTEKGKELNRWLHNEVIPSIRKTGSYAMSASSDKRISDLEQTVASLARTMEQLAKTQLSAPKQTQKRLPAPKKEFLSLEDLASRLGFYIQELLSIGRKVPAPYMIEAILVDAGYLVRDSSISLTPTPEAKGNYKRSRGRYPTTQWDYEFVRNLVESRK